MPGPPQEEHPGEELNEDDFSDAPQSLNSTPRSHITKTITENDPPTIRILFTRAAQQEKAWYQDSGANWACCDVNDDVIIETFPIHTTITTTSGNTAATAALLQTPIGKVYGYIIPGASRIIPMGLIQRVFRISWHNSIFELKLPSGQTYPTQIINGIPTIRLNNKFRHLQDNILTDIGPYFPCTTHKTIHHKTNRLHKLLTFIILYIVSLLTINTQINTFTHANTNSTPTHNARANSGGDIVSGGDKIPGGGATPPTKHYTASHLLTLTHEPWSTNTIYTTPQSNDDNYNTHSNISSLYYNT